MEFVGVASWYVKYYNIYQASFLYPAFYFGKGHYGIICFGLECAKTYLSMPLDLMAFVVRACTLSSAPLPPLPRASSYTTR